MAEQKPILITSPVDHPIAVDFWDREFPLVTTAPIRFDFGDHVRDVSPGTKYDGESVPKWIRKLPGFGPLEQSTLLPSLNHDLDCNDPTVRRVVADARFRALLDGPTYFNGRELPAIPEEIAIAKHAGVRFWAYLKKWLGTAGVLALLAALGCAAVPEPDQVVDPPAPQVDKKWTTSEQLVDKPAKSVLVRPCE